MFLLNVTNVRSLTIMANLGQAATTNSFFSHASWLLATMNHSHDWWLIMKFCVCQWTPVSQVGCSKNPCNFITSNGRKITMRQLRHLPRAAPRNIAISDSMQQKTSGEWWVNMSSCSKRQHIQIISWWINIFRYGCPPVIKRGNRKSPINGSWRRKFNWFSSYPCLMTGGWILRCCCNFYSAQTPRHRVDLPMCFFCRFRIMRC